MENVQYLNWKRLSLAVCLSVLSACSKPVAFSTPELTMVVSPSQAMTRVEFLEKLQSPKFPNEWLLTDDSKVALQDFDSLDPRSKSVIVFYREGYRKGDVFLLISWRPVDSDPVRTLTFSLGRQYTLERFTLEDWQLFSEWYYEVIPGLFDEDIDIQIGRHPEAFTEPESLEEFYQKTGFPRRTSASQRESD